jgi:hypothetical protein
MSHGRRGLTAVHELLWMLMNMCMWSMEMPKIHLLPLTDCSSVEYAVSWSVRMRRIGESW